MSLFSQLVRAEGLTMIFTSHDLTHALNYADRIVALRGGEVVLDAQCSELDLKTLRALYE